MTKQDDSDQKPVVDFIEAFARFDYGAMADLLAVDVRSYITNRDGGVTPVHGRDAFMAAIEAVDYRSVAPQIAITQILGVEAGRVMVMIEIKAERKGRHLHNFATFLMEVAGGLIHAMWMVEALPAYSDSFWKD
ncbi:MAG: nuclear transport factor 2 family protein [Bauldia sp.]|nr:nuclear transport factor 2 family protein [Bauldia sp.]